MTMLDDDAVDLRLRRAGERLRAEAPDRAEIDAALARLAIRPVTPDRRARWVVPVTIGAVAAAVVGLVVVTASSDETAPPLDTPVASTAMIPEHPLRVFDEDFDGDGGECYEFADVTGCVPGVQRRSGRPFAATSSDGSFLLLGSRAMEATLPVCTEFVPKRWLDLVVCGGRPLVGVLPATPSGGTEWFLRDAAGEPQRLELIPPASEVLLFEVPGSAAPCIVVASGYGDGGWAEACLPGGVGVARIGGITLVVDAATGTFAGFGPSSLPACGDVDGLLRIAGSRGGVTERVSCSGDLAIAVQGPAPLWTRRSESLGMLLERRNDGWTVVADGTTLPCEPVAFCDAFGPADDLAAVAAPVAPTD